MKGPILKVVPGGAGTDVTIKRFVNMAALECKIELVKCSQGILPTSSNDETFLRFT